MYEMYRDALACSDGVFILFLFVSLHLFAMIQK